MCRSSAKKSAVVGAIFVPKRDLTIGGAEPHLIPAVDTLAAVLGGALGARSARPPLPPGVVHVRRRAGGVRVVLRGHGCHAHGRGVVGVVRHQKKRSEATG